MAGKVLPTLKNWTFKFPKNIKEEQAIVITNSDFTEEQQKDTYIGPLELVLYKTDQNQKGFFCSGLMKNFAAKYINITVVDITKQPQKIRKFQSLWE